MTFFNKKEEVLDVQLTQLGKYLLSKGKLKPKFYAFSDDEILYDPSYAGSSRNETARESSDRIQKDTQRLRTFYEHDGVETRIKALNGHTVEKPRGHGWQARIKGRTEEMPFDQAYGEDTIAEEKMGSDDRNLVRNLIGNSTIGVREVPSWNIESLYDGTIESVNISSSSPNVGIKRPVLNFEVDYTVEGFEIRASDAHDTEDTDVLSPENSTDPRTYLGYTGLEREINFLDNFKAKVDSDAIIFSIVENNVDYDLTNFDFEFYEIETKEVNPRANNAETEQLRKLYFSNDYADAEKDRYIEHYFEVETDASVASFYGFDIHGTNRKKLISGLKKSIKEYRDFLEESPGSTGDLTLGDLGEDCD